MSDASSFSTTAATAHGKVVIKLHPFESASLHHLIKALDDEVDALYPDANDFPYEGPGSWVWGMPDTNIIPSLDNAGNPIGLDKEVATQETVWRNEDPQDMQQAEKKEELFFFVAFPVKDNASGSPYDEDSAVGCVGVRLLPYFPLHRASDRQTKLGEIVGVADTPLEDIVKANKDVRTAEVKRMYVAKEWRGRKSRSSGATVENVDSLALLLVRFAEKFAREHMQVKRMVLETGMRQYGAQKIYEKNGFTRRKAFGEYAGADDEVGGLSRCYEKWL